MLCINYPPPTQRVVIRFLCSIFLLILMTTYNTTNLYAQLNVITPMPCNSSRAAWEGPKWDTVCSNLDIGLNEQGQTWGNCCFIIKYYDRIYQATSTNKMYNTNVAGIFYYGDDCELRDKDSILLTFYRKLFKRKVMEDPDFFYNLFDPPQNPAMGMHNLSLYQYTTGSCSQVDANGEVLYDVNGEVIPCDDATYCCWRDVNIILDNWYPSETIYSPFLEYPNAQSVFREEIRNGKSVELPCPNSCQPKCNNVMMEPIMQFLCDTPCNTGDWSEEKTGTLTVAGCAPCEITIKFRTRETNPCPELNMDSYNDIYLDRIIIPDDPSNPCHYCTLPDQTIHTFVMNYLINNEFTNVPIGPNRCKTNYRVLQAACWHDHYTEGFWGPQRVLIKCGNDNCCVHKYKLCTNPNGELLPPILIESSADSFQCHVYPYPCFFICDTE